MAYTQPHRAICFRFILATITLLLISSTPLLILPVHIVDTAPTPPPATYSYYMWTTNTTTLYNLGHTLGQQDLNTAGAQDHFVILDFGAPRAPSSGGHITYSTILFDTSVYASVDQIAAAVEQFARGYYFGTGSDTSSTLFVAIGTSNNHDANGNYVTPDHGQAWARMVNTVESWIQSNGYSSQVQAVGASDMELGYNDKTTTIGWVDAYSQNALWALYNYGNAPCPTSGTSTTNQNCSVSGWTQDDVYHISYGAPKALSSPQMYNTAGTNAKQWRQIADYAYDGPHHTKMFFYAEITQYKACQQRPSSFCTGTNNTSSVGWTQFWNELNANNDSRTAQNIRWSTDIRYQ